jgi:hypothetical protein
LSQNAARLAFGDDGRKIHVKLSRCGPFINCRVADDGTAPEKIQPGWGLPFVEGFIASLHGAINQYFGPGEEQRTGMMTKMMQDISLVTGVRQENSGSIFATWIPQI